MLARRHKTYRLSLVLAFLPVVLVAAETPALAIPQGLTNLDGQVSDVRQIPKEEMQKLVAGKDSAPAPIGTFHLEIDRTGKGKFEEIGVQAPVHPKDMLKTNDKTIAQIQLLDGTRFVLGHNSQVTITSRVDSKDGIRTVFTLNYGLIRIRTAPESIPKSVVVETTAAQIQDIGTVFIIRHRLPKAGGKVGVTWVTLLNGQIFGQGKLEKREVKLVTIGQKARFGDPEEGEEEDLLTILDTEALRKLMEEIPWMVDGQFRPGEENPGMGDLPPRAIPNETSTGTRSVTSTGVNFEEPTVSP